MDPSREEVFRDHGDDSTMAVKIALGLAAGDAEAAAALVDRAVDAFWALWGPGEQRAVRARALRAVARALERTGCLAGKQVVALARLAGCVAARKGEAPFLDWVNTAAQPAQELLGEDG